MTASPVTPSSEAITQPQMVETAAALLIGNELLSGKVRDQNLHELSRCLRGLGILLRRAVFVADDVSEIAREMRALSLTHSVVFTSGGVGPTHDDVTLMAASAAFSSPLIQHPDLVTLLRGAYGTECTDEHLLMARAPAAARLAFTRESRWPALVIHNVWMLPGVPEVFRSEMAVLRSQLRGPAPFFSRQVQTRLDEPGLVPALNATVAAHPEVEIGSYPRSQDPKCKTLITFDSRNESAVERAVNQFLGCLPPEEPVLVE